MNIFFAILFFLLGSAAYYFFYKKTADVLNPFAIAITAWLYVSALAVLNLSKLQTPWSFEMYIAVLLFPTMVFFVGAYRVRISKLDFKKKRFVFYPTYLLFSRLIFLICIICSVVEWAAQDFILPVFADATDKKHLIASVPGFHYGSIFLPYCAIASVFELLYRDKLSKVTIATLCGVILWTLFHTIMIKISRGTLLIMGVGLLPIILRVFKLSLKGFLILLAVNIVGFVVLGVVRIRTVSMVYGVVDGHPLLSSVYSYSAMCIENLNKLVTKGPAWTIFSQTFWGLLELLNLSKYFTYIPGEVTMFFNASTVCTVFYQDLGLLGIAAYTAGTFYIVRLAYLKSFYSPGYILLFAALQKPIWMCFYGNYFTTGGTDMQLFFMVFVFALIWQHGNKIPLGKTLTAFAEKL